MAFPYPPILEKWLELSTAVKAFLPELPALVDEQAQFEAVVGEALDLHFEIQDLLAQLAAKRRQRQVVERRGRELRSRLVALLLGKLGPRSEELKRFGIQPQGKPRASGPRHHTPYTQN